MQLNELFNKPYPFEWGKMSNGMVYDFGAHFITDEGHKIDVLFEDRNEDYDPDKPVWELSFRRDGEDMEITGQGDAYRIFATLSQIVDIFVAKYNPPVLLSEAMQPSRQKLYRRMFTHLSKKFNLKLIMQQGFFILYDPNVVSREELVAHPYLQGIA